MKQIDLLFAFFTMIFGILQSMIGMITERKFPIVTGTIFTIWGMIEIIIMVI